MTSHTIKFRGLSVYVKGIYEKPEEETNYKGGFGATNVIIQDHEGNEADWFYYFDNSDIEEINRIVFEENY